MTLGGSGVAAGCSQCWAAASPRSELSSLPQQAWKDSPVNMIPERIGVTWARRVSFARLPELPRSPRPAVCAPTVVPALECRGVWTRREGALLFAASSAGGAARAPSGVCGADVLLYTCLSPGQAPVKLSLWCAFLSAPSCSAEAPQCWAPDSFLPRKGKLLWCEIPPELQHILLLCCSLAPCSGSGISLFLVCFIFLRVFLAVGPPVPWGTLPVPAAVREEEPSVGAPVCCRGGFAGASPELHLEGTGACWSGPAVVSSCPSAAACPGPAPRATLPLPQPHLPRGDTQCHPQLVRRATCFVANKI